MTGDIKAVVFIYYLARTLKPVITKRHSELFIHKVTKQLRRTLLMTTTTTGYPKAPNLKRPCVDDIDITWATVTCYINHIMVTIPTTGIPFKRKLSQ